MWLTQSDARYPCGHVVASSVSLISVQARKIAHFTAPPFPKKSNDFSGTLSGRAFFCVAAVLQYQSLPAEKEILCFSASVLDTIFLSAFKQTKKPLHGITNDKRIFLLLISQCYVTALKFKVLACLCNFQLSKSLRGILEYHSGDMAVKILGKFFSMPCGQKFYSIKNRTDKL